MCAPDQRKQPCQLGCEEGFNQVGNDLFIECFCKRGDCEVRAFFSKNIFLDIIYVQYYIIYI